MSHWWRAHDDAVDNPKLVLLSDRAHRAWFNLCCLTSANGGNLPDLKVILVKLRMPAKKFEAVLAELRDANLIDEDETGRRPHDWNGRQFKSDVSTDRVQRFRERQRNVSVTPPDNREQITEAERTDSRAVAVATRPSVDPFDEFWKAYPRRDGANPKAPARKKFIAAVKSGADARAIIAAAQRSADEARAKGQIGTPYVPQAMTWLGQQRWGDYTEPATAAGAPAPPDPSMPSDDELKARYAAKLPHPTPGTPSLFREGDTAHSADELALHHPPGRA